MRRKTMANYENYRDSLSRPVRFCFTNLGPLAPGNKDLFVHVSETFGDNAAPKDLLAAIG